MEPITELNIALDNHKKTLRGENIEELIEARDMLERQIEFINFEMDARYKPTLKNMEVLIK